ncbi:(d)CMP kinase [Bacteroidota bacterium]
MMKIIIAVDGQSGCGKSSTAKIIARELNYTYIDSGAMYRAVTLYFIRHGINIEDQQKVIDSLKNILISFKQGKHGSITFLNGEEVENLIRTPDVAALVSEVSAISPVRREMVKKQREMSADKGVVMDGRDIGTVVFPDADLKVFMTAGLEVRAERRLKELEEKGIPADLDEIKENLIKRDRIDSSRADSPLMKADGAMEVDTTNLLFEEQVNIILQVAKNMIGDEGQH